MKGPFIYHVRHPVTGEPVATVAIERRRQVWSRGVSVVNPRDQFENRAGRVKAIGLLFAAFHHRKNVKPFGPRNPKHKNAVKTNHHNYRYIFADLLEGQPQFHSQYDVTLTPYELNTVLPKSVSEKVAATAKA